MSQHYFIRSLWLVAVLATACLPMPALHAQSSEPTVHGRYLLIFDTSSDMKKRMTAVEKSLSIMLVTSMNGELHKGDTIGVWTFNQDLHPGDFPLQAWNPDNAALVASNLTRFVRSQKYANATRFEALQPLLNRVVDGSERLTVIIFTDGATKMNGTTFDTGINQLFEQNVEAQKKAREPFVVVLRSQQGKYVGCTVTYAPQAVSLPQFPPLPAAPESPKPAPKPATNTVAAPVAVAPSMFISGTNVESRVAAPVVNPAPTMPPPVIEPAPAIITPAAAPVIAPAVPLVPSPTVATSTPVVVPVPPTNPTVTPSVNPPAPTPAPVVVPPQASAPPHSQPAVVPALAPLVADTVQPTAPTNNSAPTAGSSSGIGKMPLIIGAICLLALGLLVVLLYFYFRRPGRGSLISRSMHDR